MPHPPAVQNLSRVSRDKSMVKSSCVFYKEAIRKTVTLEKLFKKPAEKIQFSQLVKCSCPQSSRPVSRKGASASSYAASPEAFFFSFGKRRREKRF